MKKNILEFNKRKNTDFLKRIKDNEKFISNNIINKDSNAKYKGNSSYPKLKLFKHQVFFVKK